MNPWVIAAGAALGAVRSGAQEAQANRDRNVQAIKTRWSPWTGQVGHDVKQTDYMGNIMQGGMAGAMMGQQGAGGAEGAAGAAPAAGAVAPGAVAGATPVAPAPGMAVQPNLYAAQSPGMMPGAGGYIRRAPMAPMR